MKIKYDKDTGIRTVVWPDGTPTRLLVLPSFFNPKLWMVYDSTTKQSIVYNTLTEACKAAKAMV